MTAQQYRLLSGVVSELVVHSGEEEFIRSSGERTGGVGVAGGLAAAGLAGAAASAGMAAASAGDSVEFFSCKVDEAVMTGRFSKVTFQDGDPVDVVLENARVGNFVLALRRGVDQSLWIAPHRSRGTEAHRAFAMRLFGWLSVGLPMFFVVMEVCLELWTNRSDLTAGLVQDAQNGFLPAMVAVGVALGLAGAVYYAIGFYRRWLPIAQQAEAIFAVLGYAEPSKVDLEYDHKLYCKYRGIKWPYLSDGPWIYHYLNESLKKR